MNASTTDSGNAFQIRPWKWCPSHVWRGLPLCQFWSSYRPLCSRLRPDVRDRRNMAWVTTRAPINVK